MQQQTPAAVPPSPLERARHATILALGLMTVSQFLNYVAAHAERRQIELLGVYTPNATSGFGVEQAVPGQSGWSLHPYAWLILGALLVLFAVQPDLGQGWRRWRYWAAVGGMALCLFPFDVENLPGWGFVLGAIAVAIGVWSARLAGRAAAA